MSDDPVVEASGEGEEAAGGWPPWVEQWVLPFIRESGLWPVLVALLGHVLVLIAPLLLALWRGNPGASVPLTVLILASFWLCKTEHEANGRLGAVTGVVLGSWLASAGLAWVAHTTGVL
jgi:hypothetical protein